MDKKVLDFLRDNRVSVLATILSDGSPHVAALHYSHRDEPLTLYFQTDKASRKCQDILGGKSCRASVVVGLDENEMLTLQMDGEIKIITDSSEAETMHAIHDPKHPDSVEFSRKPETALLAFTPSWWRFTDYNTDPETIISSE